jgi:hypothetical protein
MKKISLTLFVCISVSVLATPPEGREWVPFAPMTDEFDGTALDLSKWYDHNPTWSGRPPSLFHPDCVAVPEGEGAVARPAAA